MRTNGIACVVAAAALAWMGSCVAAAEPRHDAEPAMAKLREAFARRYPATRVEQIRATPIEGLFEVHAGPNVLYTDVHARYVLFGHLFDVQTQTDLTAQAQARVARIDWHSLPWPLALVHGEGKRQLAVIADPLCPHCRALQAQLERTDDLIVHTFVVPMLGEDSLHRARAVWCDADPARAWQAWMRDGRVASGERAIDASCSERVDALRQWAEQAGVRAVPTLINERGEVLRGVPSPAQLEGFIGGVE